ncbi:MAG: hypothetical protein ACMZ7B_04490 [Balneola sp.]
MKTRVNSIVGKPGKAVALFGVLAIIIASCTQVESPFSVQEPDVKSFEDLNINVKYAESYDQTTITYSRHWPSSISAGLSKSASNGEGEIMIDYERIHEIVAFDEEGYMSTTTEFLEGDERMNMPESVFNDLKSEMPARDANSDEIVRQEMSDGTIKLFTRSGILKHEFTYNQEDYRVELSELEALEEWANTQNSERSVELNLNRLELEGFNFSVIEGVYAKYSVVEEFDNSEKIRYEYIDDLRSGLNIQTITYKADNRIENVQLNSYQLVNNLPVLSGQVTLQYRDVNGLWNVAYRTKMTRNNIKVIKN